MDKFNKYKSLVKKQVVVFIIQQLLYLIYNEKIQSCLPCHLYRAVKIFAVFSEERSSWKKEWNTLEIDRFPFMQNDCIINFRLRLLPVLIISQIESLNELWQMWPWEDDVVYSLLCLYTTHPKILWFWGPSTKTSPRTYTLMPKCPSRSKTWFGTFTPTFVSKSPKVSRLVSTL